MRPTTPDGSKTYVVDTSVLVSAPDALQNLTDDNTVIIPFPVLQELDRRRTDTNGVGYTARQTIRFLDQLQADASPDDAARRHPACSGGLLRFHGGELDCRAAWPGFNSGYADDAIILLASAYQESHPDEQVILVTRDAAMRCKARARGVTAEDYYSDRPVTSPEKFYSGRLRIDLPDEQAGLLSTLHVEQRLPVGAAGRFRRRLAAARQPVLRAARERQRQERLGHLQEARRRRLPAARQHEDRANASGPATPSSPARAS